MSAKSTHSQVGQFAACQNVGGIIDNINATYASNTFINDWLVVWFETISPSECVEQRLTFKIGRWTLGYHCLLWSVLATAVIIDATALNFIWNSYEDGVCKNLDHKRQHKGAQLNIIFWQTANIINVKSCLLLSVWLRPIVHFYTHAVQCQYVSHCCSLIGRHALL